MNAREKLDVYLEGWRLGQAEHSLSVITSEFYYDDPNTGRIYKDGFVAFVEAFKADAAAMNGGTIGTPFLTYSHISIQDDIRPAIAWCWWQATDTSLQGAALIHFNEKGILSEKIAYFSKLPQNHHE